MAELAVFLNHDFGTLDMGEVSQLLQSSGTESSTHSSRAEESFMRWTEESIKLLISLYHEHEHKFADVNYKNKSVWEEIAKGMKEKIITQQARSAQISGNS